MSGKHASVSHRNGDLDSRVVRGGFVPEITPVEGVISELEFK